MSTLAGELAIVSGGNSGIGLAIAQRFVAEGAHVFIFARRQEQLDAAVKSIGRNVTAIQADAANLDDLDRVAARIKADKGVVDIIVSNAGYRPQGVTVSSPLRVSMSGRRLAKRFIISLPTGDALGTVRPNEGRGL